MYNKKKKIEKRKILLICFLIFCIILGFIANIVSTDRNLTIFEKAIKDSVTSIQRIISYPIDLVIKITHENKEKNKMYNDYESLKKQLEESIQLSKENDELKKQLEEMKQLLNIDNSLNEYIVVNTTVINRDLSYWYDTITIDKGENDGIAIDMPVVIGNELVGKIIKTSSFTSTVRLLTANNSHDKISVKIKNDDEYIYGILNGYDKENDTYIIEGISQNVEIDIGSLVTTTGMGDIFPAGIEIGNISGVNTDNFDLANVLEMKSQINFNELNYVTVLKRNATL